MRRMLTGLVAVVGCAGLVPLLAWAGAQARVRGVVVDTQGKPVAGATIMITTEELTDYEKAVEVKEDGTFTTLILDATKRYKFTVKAPGYITYEEPFKVSVGTTENDFKFQLKTEKEVAQTQQDKIYQQPGYKELKEAADLITAGKLAEADAKLEIAASALTDPLPAWVALADISARAGDNAKALERARKCLELDKDDTRCLAIAANSARALGDDAAYQGYLSRYQELNPDDPATLFNQAAEHLNKMDDAAARPLLEKCLQVDPAFPKCLFEYGMILLRAGDMAGAKVQLQRYLEVAPSGEDASTAAETVKYL